MDQLRPVSKLEKNPVPDHCNRCCMSDPADHSSPCWYADAG